MCRQGSFRCVFWRSPSLADKMSPESVNLTFRDAENKAVSNSIIIFKIYLLFLSLLFGYVKEITYFCKIECYILQ